MKKSGSDRVSDGDIVIHGAEILLIEIPLDKVAGGLAGLGTGIAVRDKAGDGDFRVFIRREADEPGIVFQVDGSNLGRSGFRSDFLGIRIAAETIRRITERLR